MGKLLFSLIITIVVLLATQDIYSRSAADMYSDNKPDTLQYTANNM